jgi:hypothetical protein
MLQSILYTCHQPDAKGSDMIIRIAQSIHRVAGDSRELVQLFHQSLFRQIVTIQLLIGRLGHRLSRDAALKRYER